MKRKKRVDRLLSRIGEIVFEERQRLQLSQEAFGADCNLHRSYISDIERGERNMTLGSLQAIANALGLSLTELVEMAEDKE